MLHNKEPAPRSSPYLVDVVFVFSALPLQSSSPDSFYFEQILAGEFENICLSHTDCNCDNGMALVGKTVTMRVRHFGDQPVGLEQAQPACDFRRSLSRSVRPLHPFGPEFLKVAVANSFDREPSVSQEGKFACVFGADGT
jgi:hypothetical protein